jgi:predicted dehydrogenase
MGINVAVVGLNFGSLFAPVYRAHPDVDEVVVVDMDAELAANVLAEGGATRSASRLEDVLVDDTVDAVHILTPPHLHAPMSIEVLRAGKHVASAIPAATEMGHLHELVALQGSTGRNYMMMETALYYPPAIHVRHLLAEGAFGELAFGRGAHYQDMTNWSAYWDGYPPHLNITHAIGPLLMLLDTRATTVRCLGSGRVLETDNRWENPYPVETAIFELERGDVAIDVTRSMSRMRRQSVEAFSLYGDRLGFEWGQTRDEDPVFFEPTVVDDRFHDATAERRPIPDYSHLLIEPLRAFDAYGGAVAHLVQEFVGSIVEGRLPWMDAVRGAEMTGAGIAAHSSAMSGGSVVPVPDFRA